jgi:hypothetical protein
MKTTEPTKIVQFRVDLDFIKPPIWRRILVQDKMTLLELHDVIQDVFDWTNSHLHEFTFNDARYSDPANDTYGEFDLLDEAKFKLRDLNLTEGARIVYLYDFGDSWRHSLVVEKILPFEKGMQLPQCTAGKRSCPPEDVGGPGGYQFFLKAIRDPQHKEHDQYLEWIGGDFDPEEFDLQAANRRLRERADQKLGWGGPLSSPETEAAQIKRMDAANWQALQTHDHEETAKALALRLDVVTFLEYIQENKVTGTQSTGNLPRKAIDAIAPRFVHPPALESRFGDVVFRYQTEVEVWPLFFIHALARGAELIRGGPGRRWTLTSAGEHFLGLPAVAQVWTLLDCWWNRMNWRIAYSEDLPSDSFQEWAAPTAAAQLAALPAGDPQPFEAFADQLIEAAGWKLPKQVSDRAQIEFREAILYMVFEPLENFGVLTTPREKDYSRLQDTQPWISFSLTGFGLALLKSI